MKKVTLFLVATLFSALSFAALNPYAYGLKSTLSSDQKTLTVEYSLNAPATSVVWKLMDGDKVVKTLDLTAKGLAKGSYTIAIPTMDFPLGKSLTWEIEVKGTSVSTPTVQDDLTYKFYQPYGLTVDVDTESEYFGRTYVIEANNGGKTKAGYQSNPVGRALYVFDPALNPIKNKNGSNGFTGGLSLGANSSNSAGAYVNLYRVATSGGRVFIGRIESGQAPIVEVNPAVPTLYLIL